jgi:hypothetical protein
MTIEIRAAEIWVAANQNLMSAFADCVKYRTKHIKLIVFHHQRFRIPLLMLYTHTFCVRFLTLLSALSGNFFALVIFGCSARSFENISRFK